MSRGDAYIICQCRPPMPEVHLRAPAGPPLLYIFSVVWKARTAFGCYRILPAPLDAGPLHAGYVLRPPLGQGNKSHIRAKSYNRTRPRSTKLLQ